MESGFANGGGGVATRWTFSARDPLRSGLATVLAGGVATVVATPWSTLTWRTPPGGPSHALRPS